MMTFNFSQEDGGWVLHQEGSRIPVQYYPDRLQSEALKEARKYIRDLNEEALLRIHHPDDGVIEEETNPGDETQRLQ